jgi:hypothetical protein
MKMTKLSGQSQSWFFLTLIHRKQKETSENGQLTTKFASSSSRFLRMISCFKKSIFINYFSMSLYWITWDDDT